MIACLGETTGVDALTKILNQMRSTEEGTRILLDRPRINSRAIDLDALKRLPEDTYGFAYRKFLDDNVNMTIRIFSLLKQNVFTMSVSIFIYGFLLFVINVFDRNQMTHFICIFDLFSLPECHPRLTNVCKILG